MTESVYFELKKSVRGIVAEVANLRPDFDEHQNLYYELGVASIKAIQLLLALEERFAIPIPDDAFVEATSLEALTSMMAQFLDRAPDLHE